MSVFAVNRMAKFKETMTVHLGDLAAKHVAAMGHENMNDFLDQAIWYVRRYDIHQEETTRLWLELSMLWGIKFISDPTYEFAQAIVKSPLPELPRMRRLHAASIAHVNRTCGPDGKSFRAALERLEHLQAQNALAEVQLDNEDLANLLAQLWPERAEAIGPESLEKLAEETTSLAQEFGSQAGRVRILFAVLGLILGAGFATDPQYRWLMRESVVDETPEVRFDALLNRSRAYLRTVLRHA